MLQPYHRNEITLQAVFPYLLFPCDKNHRSDIKSNWSYQCKQFLFCFTIHLTGYISHIDKEWKELELTALYASAKSYNCPMYKFIHVNTVDGKQYFIQHEVNNSDAHILQNSLSIHI